MIADDAFSRSEPPYYFTSLPDVPMLDLSRRVLTVLHAQQPDKIARETTPPHRIWFGMQTAMTRHVACGECKNITSHAALLRNMYATWFLMECAVCRNIRAWTFSW